jgi:hypothetical protein
MDPIDLIDLIDLTGVGVEIDEICVCGTRWMLEKPAPPSQAARPLPAGQEAQASRA